MKKIGQGWQYSVYDLGNGRVLKKFHSWPKAYWVIFKNIFPFKEDSMFEISSFIKDMKRKMDHSLKVMSKIDIPQEYLANPNFLNKYDFEQDKVKPLHDIFDAINAEEGKKIISDFIEFNKKLFNLGFIDKSFNITKNYGLNDNGEIVLIDIGELFDDQEKIKKQLNDKCWEKHYVVDGIKSKELREYFINEMNKNFLI